MIKKFSRIVLIFNLLLISTNFSQTLSSTSAKSNFPPSYYDIVALLFLVIIVVGFISIIYFEEKNVIVKKYYVKNAFSKIRQIVTRLIPIKNKGEALLDSNNDRVKKISRKIPTWFIRLFYAAILIGILFILYHYVFNTTKIQAEDAKRETLIKSPAFLNEESVTFLIDPTSINAGKQIFKTNCVICHGPDGGGLVGPNLTDDYWIHGGGIKNIIRTIINGVAAKGMISWQSQLSPKQIEEVASYVISLHGTKPINPKPPQGILWIDSTITGSTKLEKSSKN